MTPVETLRGRSVALFGLGGSGLATLRALVAGGARSRRLGRRREGARARRRRGLRAGRSYRRRLARLRGAGARAGRAADPSQAALDGRAGARRPASKSSATSSSSPASAPPARRDAPLVAITGTNGKSTTTALIAHILRAGRARRGDGRQHRRADSRSAAAADGRVHVVECSSFQIDLAPSLEPSVGALINITPDHLDRHGTMENYAAIKERLVARAETALIGVDDEPCRAIAQRLRASQAASGTPRVVAVSAAPSPLADVWIEDRFIVARPGSQTRVDLRLAPALRGAHNGQNAAFAFAAARALGLGVEEIARGLASFPASRIAWSRWGGSAGCCSSTTPRRPTPTPPKRRCCRFDDIFWILGGKAKEGGIEPLRPFVSARRQGLSDRRGERGFRAHARRRRGVRAVRRRWRTRVAPRRAMRRRAPRPSRWCCCRRPAPLTISSPISKRAAIVSAISSPR